MPLIRSALVKRAKNIKLVGMDVDGVLTGGEIVILESGEEIKFWNAKDRLGLALLRTRKVPLDIVWITGRRSRAVEWAAKDLGVHTVVQGCHDKNAAMQDILKSTGLSYEETAFIGDDLIDIPVLCRAGFAACPKDAATDVKRVAHYVSPLNGGRGVARDVIEFILKARQLWQPVVRTFTS